MQLCFSLSDQEAHDQGCGLPRELVERMPVVVGERTEEREVERGGGQGYIPRPAVTCCC